MQLANNCIDIKVFDSVTINFLLLFRFRFPSKSNSQQHKKFCKLQKYTFIIMHSCYEDCDKKCCIGKCARCSGPNEVRRQQFRKCTLYSGKLRKFNVATKMQRKNGKNSIKRVQLQKRLSPRQMWSMMIVLFDGRKRIVLSQQTVGISITLAIEKSNLTTKINQQSNQATNNNWLKCRYQ